MAEQRPMPRRNPSEQHNLTKWLAGHDGGRGIMLTVARYPIFKPGSGTRCIHWCALHCQHITCWTLLLLQLLATQGGSALCARGAWQVTPFCVVWFRSISIASQSGYVYRKAVSNFRSGKKPDEKVEKADKLEHFDHFCC